MSKTWFLILGIGMVKRKMAKQIYPTVEIQFDGSTFSQTTKTSAKTTTITFKLDEPFEQELEELGITKKVNIRVR